MGKSAVLKDHLNRPAGYMRLAQDCVMIRVPLEEAANLRIVFSDGSSREYELNIANGEQRFLCGRSDVIGCCVFREKELILASNDAMRRSFERQACRKKGREAEEIEAIRQDERLNNCVEKKESEHEKVHIFAQQRWPPPPCWDEACYSGGAWQEQ